MRSRRCLTAFCLLLLTNRAYCCINEYRTLLSGEVVYAEAVDKAPGPRFNSEDHSGLLKKLHEADSIYRLTGKLEDYSDLGAMFLYTGQYLQAKKIFLEIERNAPGLYQTAANLGTTYELLGRNDSALYWIRKAVEINPGSHRGSEWIHVKILEAKIKANGSENYLWTHSILGLNFGDDKAPENKNNIDLYSLRDHLYEQLEERMFFIKPKDPVVAQLLFDLGNVMAITEDVKSGLQIYEAAKEYGYSSHLLSIRESYFNSLQSKADLRGKIEETAKDNPLLTLLILAVFGVGFIAGLMFLVRRFRKRQTL